jgi:hypothetical protein
VFLFGAVAGCLIRRDGPWPELFLLAAVGAVCLFFAFDSQWAADLRSCDPSKDPGCDITGGFGAAVGAAICYVPMLAGAVVGRAVAVAGSLAGRRYRNAQGKDPADGGSS